MATSGDGDYWCIDCGRQLLLMMTTGDYWSGALLLMATIGQTQRRRHGRVAWGVILQFEGCFGVYHCTLGYTTVPATVPLDVVPLRAIFYSVGYYTTARWVPTIYTYHVITYKSSWWKKGIDPKHKRGQVESLQILPSYPAFHRLSGLGCDRFWITSLSRVELGDQEPGRPSKSEAWSRWTLYKSALPAFLQFPGNNINSTAPPRPSQISYLSHGHKHMANGKCLDTGEMRPQQQIVEVLLWLVW